MNLVIYLPLVIVITLFFLISYIKMRKPFQLAFAIWVPSTLLQYLDLGRGFFNVLSVIEILFCIVCVALLILNSVKHKKEEGEENK